MSSSRSPVRQKFTLALSDLPLDANLTVYDGRDHICLSSTGKRSTSTLLPKGLYTVRGELAGVTLETPVRLDRNLTLANTQPTLLVPPQYTAAPLEGTAFSQEYYRYPSRQWSLKSTRPPFGKKTAADSSLFLFIRPRESGLVKPATEETVKLRLLDAEGSVVTRFGAGEVQRGDSTGWLALSFQAPSGYYTLEHHGKEPRAMALELFPNWQTQVFLLNHGRLLMEGARIFLSRSDTGFNPERDDMTRATDLGLDFLQNNLKRLPSEVQTQLLRLKFANPMLGLVGAHALLKEQKPDQHLLGIVIKNLRNLIGECADLAAVELLLALRLGRKIRPFLFEHPPMFRAGLEAVVRASFDKLELLPKDGLIERITPYQLADSPWSTWSIDGSAKVAFGYTSGRYPMAPGLAFGLPSHLSPKHTARGPLAFNWIQAAFLDTVAGQIRAKRIAGDRGKLIGKPRGMRTQAKASPDLPETLAFGEVKVDLRKFTLDLGLPRRSVMESVNQLLALRMSPDELLSVRTKVNAENISTGAPRSVKKRPGASIFGDQNRVVLAGSEKAAAEYTVDLKPTPSKSRMTVSVIVRRKTPLKLNRSGDRAPGPVRVSRAEYKKFYSADPTALKLVVSFAREFNLKVEQNPDSSTGRTVLLTGTAAAIQKAFGVKLNQAVIDGVEYRVREGGIHLPEMLIGAVLAVLGLDNRPQAKPHFRIRRPDPMLGLKPAESGAPSSYTPPEVAKAYQFPSSASGAGQTIGIIELGGSYRTGALTAYFKSLGLAVPAIKAVSVHKGKDKQATLSSVDDGVMLDIEVAASLAPGANIVVYFAPNTDQGFTDAITRAVHDTVNRPSVISIGWGAAESSWTLQAMMAMDEACQSAAALGVTVTAAVGDSGSTDGGTGNNVDFPASSPHVLACGGTKLDADGAMIVSEVVWNTLAIDAGATGGGVSKFFPLPSWQANSNVPRPATASGGRGVPDVAGVADPNTGYNVRVNGHYKVIGGTRAVASLWAGLMAVANCQLGKNVGFINPAIYAAKAASAFNNITAGNNGAFSAGPGWDPCTGLGSPVANKLIPHLMPLRTTERSPSGWSTAPTMPAKKKSTTASI